MSKQQMKSDKTELQTFGEFGAPGPSDLHPSAPKYQCDHHDSPPPDYEDIHKSTKYPDGGTASVKSSSSPNLKYIVILLLTLLVCGAVGGITYGIVFAVTSDDIQTTSSPGSTLSTAPITSTSDPSTTSTTSAPSMPGWASWTPWSDCSTSCDGGEQTRTRECQPEGHECKGTDIQGQPCSEQACPAPDYGEWSSWSRWTPCTTSCGEDGMEYRARRCDKETTEQLDCPGDKEYTDDRPCNRFDCPTCSRPCPDGGQNSQDCLTCVCSGNDYTAKVVTSTNKPLTQVRVSDVEVPSHELTRSNSEGEFTIPDACNGITLQFERVDLVANTSVISPMVTYVYLEKIENLDISQHPEDKVRLVGDSVMLCCEATGNPPPESYEWFRDGVTVSGDAGSLDGILVLDNLDVSHSGYYQCRASNDHSSVRSNDALLQIEDEAGKFCSLYPGTNIITLPKGCEQEDGSLEMDVGGCNPDPCPGQGEGGSGGCTEEGKYCCGARSIERVDVQCRGFVLPVYMVTECGCIECPEESVIILGLVLALNTNNPVSTAGIFVNGSEVENAVNSDGQFMLEVPIGITRFIVTVTDESGTFADNTKVVHFASKPPRILYTVVKLLPYIKQPNIDSTIQAIINIGDEQPFAQVAIPPNSIYAMDGSLYSGSVEVKAGIIDPKNYSSVLSSPGDFSALDANGSPLMLKTYGMVSLRLSDPSTGNLLQVKDKVQMVLDNTLWGDEVDEDGNPLAKLWSLNVNTGNWEVSASMKRENQSFPQWRKDSNLLNAGLFSDIIVGDTEIDGKTWTNFDGNEHRVCYAKVRLFEDSRFLFNSQLPVGATVTMVALHKDKDTKTYADVSTTPAMSDTREKINGYCVIGFCDVHSGNNYEGYIIAEHESQQLHAADKNNPFHHIGLTDQAAQNLEYEAIIHEDYPALFTRFAVHAIPDGEKGPLYEWTDTGSKKWANSETCSSADFSENQYRFYKTEAYDDPCTAPPYYVQRPLKCPQTPPHANWLAWFPESQNSPPSYSTCFVKVAIENGVGHTFQARSQMGNCSHSNGQVGVGDLYGLHQICPTSNDEAFCMEVKHAGIPTECGEENKCEHSDETLVTIEEVPEGSSKSCKISDYSVAISAIIWHKHVGDDETFKMYLDDSNKGEIYGIYCARNKASATEVTDAAYQMCANGDDDHLNVRKPDEINKDFLAFKIKCD